MTTLLFLVWLGAVVFVSALPSGGEETMELVAPYLRARDGHMVGEVVGHAVHDPRHPSAPDLPNQGVSVMLLPYSIEFESQLDQIRDSLRDSLKHYMGAMADVGAVRQAYEQRLLWAGGGELIRGEVSDARGLVRLDEVPIGEWVLLAWQEEGHPGKALRLGTKETKGFRDIPVSAGYSVVTYWHMRVQVRGAGESTAVNLSDRNVWMTGIREDLLLMQGTPRPAPSVAPPVAPPYTGPRR
jgi:hypothetical protein